MKLNKKGVKQFDDNLIDNGEFSDMTATIQDSKTIWKNLKKCRGDAFLFKLSPPWQGHEYVLESTIPTEVMYFASDKHGKVKDFTDLPLDLDKEGYQVV